MTVCFFAGALLLGVGREIRADDSTVKTEAQQAGRSVDSAARQVGEGAKQAGQEVAKTAKKIGKDVANAAKEAGKEIAAAANKTGSDAKHASKTGVAAVRPAGQAQKEPDKQNVSNGSSESKTDDP